MNIQDCNLRPYEFRLRSIALKDEGVKTLTKIVAWPDGKFSEPMQTDILCEYEVFNVCVKHPFLEIITGILLERIGKLYELLTKSKLSYCNPLTYEEAFYLFIYLGEAKTRALLDVIDCSSFVYNKLLQAVRDNDFDLFRSAFGGNDFQDMMRTLRSLQYILTGKKTGITKKDINDSKSSQIGGISKWLYYDGLFEYFYCDSPKDDIERMIKSFHSNKHGIIKRIARGSLGQCLSNDELDSLKSITSIADGSYYSEWLDKLNSLASDRINFGNYLKVIESSFAYEDLRIPYSIISNVIYDKNKTNLPTIDLKELVDNPKCNKQASGYEGIDAKKRSNKRRQNCQRYNGQADDKDKLGDIIILCTTNMLYIYNIVKTILTEEERCILEWLLSISAYTHIVEPVLNDPLIAFNIPESPVSNSQTSMRRSLEEPNGADEYGEILKKWKEKNIEENTFEVNPALNDEKILALHKGLSEKRYISSRTTPDTLKYVLGCGEKPNDYEPIIWIKENSKRKHSKISVLNFLLLLGIEWNEIEPKRLNYCFISQKPNANYKEFDKHNLQQNRNGKQYKVGTSEQNEELQTIIEEALSKNHVICRRWKNLILDIEIKR